MKKILIIRFGAIGDVILSSATAINLKLSFPDAEIYYLTRQRTSGLLSLFAGVDEILEFPQKATFKDLYRMGEYLDNLRFDIIVDLHGNFRSKYLMFHVTAPVKVRYDKRRFERFKEAGVVLESKKRLLGARERSLVPWWLRSLAVLAGTRQ